MNRKAVVVLPIYATRNTWRLADPSDLPDRVSNREVTLEIDGDEKQGFHLIKSPEGCFTADTWHPTVAEAMAEAEAEEAFGVDPASWSSPTGLAD